MMKNGKIISVKRHKLGIARKKAGLLKITPLDKAGMAKLRAKRKKQEKNIKNKRKTLKNKRK